jgi:hypothetical protein
MFSISTVNNLRVIKSVHTAVWAFFVSCIIAIPVLASQRNYLGAAAFISIVFVEVLVIVFNGWHCPLTSVAARYTADRRDNFDIYLPQFLARHNKFIFGILYFAGILYTLGRWLTAR